MKKQELSESSDKYKSERYEQRDALLVDDPNAQLHQLRSLIDEGLNSGPAEKWNANDFLKEMTQESMSNKRHL